MLGGIYQVQGSSKRRGKGSSTCQVLLLIWTHLIPMSTLQSISIIIPFLYRGKLRHRELKFNLPNVIQVVSGRAHIWSQALWLQSLCPPHRGEACGHQMTSESVSWSWGNGAPKTCGDRGLRTEAVEVCSVSQLLSAKKYWESLIILKLCFYLFNFLKRLWHTLAVCKSQEYWLPGVSNSNSLNFLPPRTFPNQLCAAFEFPSYRVIGPGVLSH